MLPIPIVRVVPGGYFGPMTIMAETISSERLEQLLADDSIAVVHRTLWVLLWEGELRVLDLLNLDVRDVVLDDHVVRLSSERVSRGGQAEFSARAATLLRELIGDRQAGPLFAMGERVLSWEQAMQAAGDHGCAIHGFRSGGKRHRVDQR